MIINNTGSGAFRKISQPDGKCKPRRRRGRRSHWIKTSSKEEDGGGGAGDKI